MGGDEDDEMRNKPILRQPSRAPDKISLDNPIEHLRRATKAAEANAPLYCVRCGEYVQTADAFWLIEGEGPETKVFPMCSSDEANACRAREVRRERSVA
jgi:hypothetical protein